MTLKPLSEAIIKQVKTESESVEFNKVIEAIDSEWTYTPTAFSNGKTTNEAGTNEGSCKIFAFAQANELSEPETLALFGTYYRDDVLGNPEGNDHANIRNFMKTGWAGISFTGQALSL